MKESEKMNGVYKRLEEEVLRGIEKKDILAIETDVKQFQGQSLEARAKAVICLQYLSKGRFRENEFYRNTTFEHYMEAAHGITTAAFQDMKFAIMHHYKDAEKYGFGTIAKIRRTCGATNVGKVLSKIHMEEEKRKTPITSITVNEIIDKNRIPKAASAIKLPEPDYKQMFESVTQSKRESDDELIILRDQVARQKDAIVRLRAKNEVLLAENAALKRKLEIIQGSISQYAGVLEQVKKLPELKMQA